MDNREGQVHLEFTIPARGLIGLRTRMLTATKGTAIMHHNFHEYAPARGDVPGRSNGVMVSSTTGTSNAFALNNLQERGSMFVEPTTPVYEGMIVAENARDNDMTVNPTTAKQLTNMRTTSSDENIILKPARKMTLEQALEYIEEDELVEATPENIRLRKQYLTENERKRAGRSKAKEEVVEV
jgi:GTP-binding protein